MQTTPDMSAAGPPGEAAPDREKDGVPLLISTAAPTRSDRVLAAAVVVALVCALAAAAPHATVPLTPSAVLLPAYLAAVLICQLITAILLFGLYAVQHAPSLLVLAAGYLFAGLMVVPWGVSFPGVFAGFGIEPRLNATATIAAVNRLVFPICLFTYALWPRTRAFSAPRRLAVTILVTVLVILGLVGLLGAAVLFTDMPLPPFMTDDLRTAPLWSVVPPVALAICVCALIALGLREKSVLDLWLMVVMASIIIEILLLAYLAGGTRLSVGWWAGRLYGLFAASVVLIVLLLGTTNLYARYARSVRAERRARESRLTVMEAISASLAHELRQPIASVGISAAGGLRWLRRDPPELAEVEAALLRVEAVGERAARLVESIRTAFKSGEPQRAELDVNAAISTAVARLRAEAALRGIEVRTDLDDDGPCVVMDSLQFQLVLTNLMDNAVEAMRPASGRRRALSVASRVSAGAVVVSVADNGIGIPAERADRIFSAFFTTKQDGMGVGLMFCRAVVETNGGRIWCAANEPDGTVFSFSLPLSARIAHLRAASGDR